MAKVDVVVPCYNYARFLRDCVTSIFAQGISDVRVLIIDNASTDNSVDIARELAAEDSRITVSAHPKNVGPHASFNEGIDWASSEYFMLLCSDDVLPPGALASMVSILDQNPNAGFACGQDIEWHTNTPMPSEVSTPRATDWSVCEGRAFIYERCKYPERPVAYSFVLCRTSVQKAAGHYKTELPYSTDFEMLLRLACFGSVASTQSVIGIRRLHDNNRSQDFAGERTGYLVGRLKAFESFFRQEGRTMPDADRLFSIAKSSLSGQAYWRGLKDVLRGRQSGFDLLRLSVGLDPLTAVVPPVGYLTRIEGSLLDRMRLFS